MTRSPAGRALMCAVLVLLVPAPAPAAPDRAFLDLHTLGRGEIATTTPDARRVRCDDPSGSCEAGYPMGTVVRLEARPDPAAGPSAFGAWSDDRCPAVPVCELRLDSDFQSVTALFTPQRVTVWMSPSQQPATVTSVPPGLTCGGPPADRVRACSWEFPLFTDVRLVAEGRDPVWSEGGADDECDAVTGAVCRVGASLDRTVRVAFEGRRRPGGQVLEALVGAFLRVAKAGTGAGTVRSGEIDCGSACTTTTAFGARASLVAQPDAGSRFVRWTGACGTGPRCSLFVGPVTRLTAVFDRVAGGVPGGNGGSDTGRRGTGGGFTASVGGVAVVRAAGRRALRFAIAVSSRATVRARLGRRARTVASRTWRIARGVRLLRLRLPPGTRPGVYRLRVTARGQAGAPKRFAARVRVRG